MGLLYSIHRYSYVRFFNHTRLVGVRLARRRYIGGKKLTAVYKLIFLAMTFIGAVSSIQLVWDLSDTFNGLMALPNLIGLLLLSGTVFKITKNYEQRVIGGKKIKPMLSFYDREK